MNNEDWDKYWDKLRDMFSAQVKRDFTLHTSSEGLLAYHKALDNYFLSSEIDNLDISEKEKDSLKEILAGDNGDVEVVRQIINNKNQ